MNTDLYDEINLNNFKIRQMQAAERSLSPTRMRREL